METDPTVDVHLMDIKKKAAAVGRALTSLTDAGLEQLKGGLNTEIKDISPGIAFHQIYNGGLLTKASYDLIKDAVPADQIKAVTVRVPVYNDNKTDVISWKEEPRYFIPNVLDLAKKSEAGTLDLDTSLAFRHADSENFAELNGLQAQKSVFTTEKKAIKSELARREAARVKVEMEKRQIKTASLKELVTKMYPAQAVVVPATV